MITVYSSPTCGKCKVLKAKLEQKGIAYDECQDEDVMSKLGIDSLPVIDVDGQLLMFTEALKFVNER